MEKIVESVLVSFAAVADSTGDNDKTQLNNRLSCRRSCGGNLFEHPALGGIHELKLFIAESFVCPKFYGSHIIELLSPS